MRKKEHSHKTEKDFRIEDNGISEKDKDCKNCRYNCSTVRCWECVDYSLWKPRYK